MADRLFTQLTQRLLAEKRVSGFFMQAPSSPHTIEEEAAFFKAFGGKSANKGGNISLPWGHWLVESLFPLRIYRGHKENLRLMLQDERIWTIGGFSGNDNNSFGRMARPRTKVPEGFVNFMLDRLGGKYGGTPLFWFDVEDPEWVCEPLSGRPDVPKTGRTSVSCVMNYGFHLLGQRLSITIGLRHMNWSHAWGDVYGGHAALEAVCRASGKEMGLVSIFANSASMDEPKIAKAYLKEIMAWTIMDTSGRKILRRKRTGERQHARKA